ncbi:MAG: thioredoxin domain-containing protein [Pseudomonadota bacterium]
MSIVSSSLQLPFKCHPPSADGRTERFLLVWASLAIAASGCSPCACASAAAAPIATSASTSAATSSAANADAGTRVELAIDSKMLFESGEPAIVEIAPQDDCPALGPRHALVTVEVFCTYYSRSCARAHSLTMEMLERHPGTLRILFRHLAQDNTDESLLAEMSREAWKQGRFTEFQTALYENQQLLGRDTERLIRLAGLESMALKKAIEDGRHRASLDQDDLLAARRGIRRAPTLMWNGAISNGLLDINGFEEEFARAFRRARRHVARDTPFRHLYQTLVEEAIAESTRPTAAPQRRKAASSSQEGSHPGGGVLRVTVPVGDAPIRGDPGAPVTVVVFSEYPCHACAILDKTLRRVHGAYAGRVRIAFRNNPSASHPNSKIAAEAAACAHRQGLFWPYHDRLFGTPGQLQRDKLVEHARAVGLEIDQFAADLDSGKCAAAVAADLEAGRAVLAGHVPAVFVNGRRLGGVPSFVEMQAAIDDELEPGLLRTLSLPPL